MKKMKRILKSILMMLNLLDAARWFRKLIRQLVDPATRQAEHIRRQRERSYHQQFLQFKLQYSEIFDTNFHGFDSSSKRALVISTADFQSFFQVELTLVKALELAKFKVSALIIHDENDRSATEYYGCAGVREILSWKEFRESPDIANARILLNKVGSIREFVSLEYAGIRVGRFAYASALRSLRKGSLDFNSPKDIQTLVEFLATAIASANGAQKILRKNRPDLLLLLDSMYSPEGELVDSCLKAGIDVVMYALAHKSSTLICKRYTLENKDEQPASLSDKSWQFIRKMDWNKLCHEKIQRELYNNYASGDWYSVACTQFDKTFLNADDLRNRLGLDPAKKTAFIFPHISWDASLMWGEDLFNNYEEWFIETVRAACVNTRVNWVIKIHPAHAGKNIIERKRGEYSDVLALRNQFKELPNHVFMIPAESDISTFSLFKIMDYCLTVRGTVGIEAGRFGIPVLTAGTGRYDRKGFTVDSESREQYLYKLANILSIPRLSNNQRDLADRFSYGLFLIRPLTFTSVTFKYHKDYGVEKRFLRTQMNIKSKEEWHDAPDLKLFAKWVNSPDQLDFLMPLD
jgi:hypothetical protein